MNSTQICLLEILEKRDTLQMLGYGIYETISLGQLLL